MNHSHAPAKAKAAEAPRHAKAPEKKADPRFVDGFDRETGKPSSTAQYQHNLRGLTPKALEHREKWLEARIKDAKTGPSKDANAVKRAEEQLKLVKTEMAERKKLGGSVAGKDHRLDTADLKKELAKQEEIYQEATTGVARDPKKALEAKKAIAAAKSELATRDRETANDTKLDSRTKQPPLTADEVKALKEKARTGKTSDLKDELKKLRSAEKDAAHGAFQNPEQAKNLRTQIRTVRNELKLRKELAKGPEPKFALQTHRASDDKVLSTRAQWAERLNEATTGVARDPKAAREARQHLAIIDAELNRRGVAIPEAQTPAPAPTPEEQPIEEPVTEAAPEDAPVPDDDLDLVDIDQMMQDYEAAQQQEDPASFI